MTNSLSLRQCHFSKQCNLLFSKYFQIFSSPANQIRDAFSLYLNTVQRGKREPENQNRYALILDMRISGSSARASRCRAACGASPPESNQEVESEEGRPEFAMWGY